MDGEGTVKVLEGKMKLRPLFVPRLHFPVSWRRTHRRISIVPQVAPVGPVAR